MPTNTGPPASTTISSSPATNRVSQYVIGLDPLRLVAASHGTLSTIRHSDVSWNWDTFEGVLELGVGYCRGAEPPDLPVVDSDAPTFDFEAVAIPRIALPAEFLDGGWRDVGLGRCSARIGGSQGSSVLRGTRASDEDAQVRVVLSAANELFVELQDDRLVPATRGWTSLLESGKWWTLGGVHEPSTGGLLDPAAPETFCTIESGTLTPRVMAFSP